MNEIEKKWLIIYIRFVSYKAKCFCQTYKELIFLQQVLYCCLKQSTLVINAVKSACSLHRTFQQKKSHISIVNKYLKFCYKQKKHFKTK